MSLTIEQRLHLTRIKSYAPFAEAGGVPGAVMVAQGTVESNWGRSGLSRKGNAFFGVKARASWSGKVYSGSTWERMPDGSRRRFPGHNTVYPSYAAAVAAGANRVALFRTYDSFEENVRDYVRFYRVNPRYRWALERYAQSKNPFSLADDIAFAEDIHAAGYATAADYARTLTRFMQLYCQDLLGATSASIPTRPKITVQIGSTQVPNEAVLVQEGKVYVHLRTIAPLVGASVRWDPDTKTATLEAAGG